MNKLVERVASCILFMHEARCIISRTDGRTDGGFTLDHSDFHYEEIKKANEEGFVRKGEVCSETYKITDLIYRRYNDWTSPSHKLIYAEFFRLGKPRRLNLEVKISYSLLNGTKNSQHIDFMRLISVEPEGDRSKTPWFAAEQL